MNLVKIITVINWVILGILGILVIAETLFPAKGGDAAGRGMGQAIYYLAIIVLVVLIILNFIPRNWAKYAAFGVIAIPFLLMQLGPEFRNMKRNLSYMVGDSKLVFEDKERDAIARAVRNGNPDKVQKLLQQPVSRLNEGGELLAFAVSETNGSTYKPAEKIECIRRLLQAGAKIDSAETDGVPVHYAVASNGHAALLHLLLENGANANATEKYAKRAVIFEAVGSYMEPEASVRALLDFGANTEVTAALDDEKGPVTPLYRAAQMGRWGICAALIEKGANTDCTAADGTSFRSYFDAAGNGFSPDGYSTQEDYARLKKVVK